MKRLPILIGTEQNLGDFVNCSIGIGSRAKYYLEATRFLLENLFSRSYLEIWCGADQMLPAIEASVPCLQISFGTLRLARSLCHLAFCPLCGADYLETPA